MRVLHLVTMGIGRRTRNARTAADALPNVKASSSRHLCSRLYSSWIAELGPGVPGERVQILDFLTTISGTNEQVDAEDRMAPSVNSEKEGEKGEEKKKQVDNSR